MVSQDLSETEWIMDSGCSFHMTPNRSCFEELKIKMEARCYLETINHSRSLE